MHHLLQREVGPERRVLGALRQRDGSLRPLPLVRIGGRRRHDAGRGSRSGRLSLTHGHREDVFALVHLEAVVVVVIVVAVVVLVLVVVLVSVVVMWGGRGGGREGRGAGKGSAGGEVVRCCVCLVVKGQCESLPRPRRFMANLRRALSKGWSQNH